MRILFLYTNINGFHESSYSFGLTSIIAISKQKGHQIDCMLITSQEEYDSVFKKIEELQPDIIGFSTVSSQFHFVKELAELIKKNYPDIIIVCGGVHPTINPYCIKEAKGIDAVFVGESEGAFRDFLDCVSQKKSFKNINNIAYRSNGGVVINPLNSLILDLDELPYSDRDNIYFEQSLKAIGFASFYFSRGCPYLCSYCSNHAIAKSYGLERNNTRYRSPESCIWEIEEVIRKYHVKQISIGDDTFGLNKKWRKEFLRKYKERIGLPFYCLLRANIVDEEFVKLIKEAGCFKVLIGVESGNEYVRNEIMKRHMTNEEIIRAFDLLRKYRIEATALNIIGVPGETEEMIWDTIRLNRRINPKYSGVNIFYPYKGTELGDYCFEHNLVDEERFKNFSNERRETVLNYPKEYRDKLTYYYDRWEELVHRWHLIHRLKMIIRDACKKLGIWNQVLKLKNSIFPRKKV